MIQEGARWRHRKRFSCAHHRKGCDINQEEDQETAYIVLPSAGSRKKRDVRSFWQRLMEMEAEPQQQQQNGVASSSNMEQHLEVDSGEVFPKELQTKVGHLKSAIDELAHFLEHRHMDCYFQNLLAQLSQLSRDVDCRLDEVSTFFTFLVRPTCLAPATADLIA